MENELNLTDLQAEVMEALINELYAEPGFSDVDVHDIAKEIGKSTKIIRGVLSSLVKRGIISVERTETFGAPKQYEIIYLNKEYWYLHPWWKNA